MFYYYYTYYLDKETETWRGSNVNNMFAILEIIRACISQPLSVILLLHQRYTAMMDMPYWYNNF